VRCDAKDGIEGKAMRLGVYDHKHGKEIVKKTPSVAEIRGSEYRWIDVGVIPLKPEHLDMNQRAFWATPPARPGEVDAVYIDRIVIVREH